MEGFHEHQEEILNLQDSDHHFPEWDSAPDKYWVSDSGTYLAYFKCFVGAGVLFLPHAFHSAGLTAALLTFVVTTILSTVCMLKMVEAKHRVVEDFKAGITHGVTKIHETVGFGMLGAVVLGPFGRALVDISIAISQLCFATAYLIFCSKNLHNIIYQFGNCDSQYFVSSFTLTWLLVPLLIPLMFIRQLSKFSTSIIVADSLIVIGLLFIVKRCISTMASQAAGGLSWGVASGIIYFNPIGYWAFLGTALYALEGTAFVIPIEHAMQNKQNFVRITWNSGLAVGALYMCFGLLGYLAFGSSVQAIITLNLQQNYPNDVLVTLMQLGYCVALFLSFPVAMFPVMKVLEPKLWPSHEHDDEDASGEPLLSSAVSEKLLQNSHSSSVLSLLLPTSSSSSASRPTSPVLVTSTSSINLRMLLNHTSLTWRSLFSNRYWQQSALRAGLTVISALIATLGAKSFDNYISLVGGLMCVPLTLIYPAYFHLKICGDRLTTRQRWVDYLCLVVGVLGTIACTVVSIWQWLQQSSGGGGGGGAHGGSIQGCVKR